MQWELVRRDLVGLAWVSPVVIVNWLPAIGKLGLPQAVGVALGASVMAGLLLWAAIASRLVGLLERRVRSDVVRGFVAAPVTLGPFVLAILALARL